MFRKAGTVRPIGRGGERRPWCPEVSAREMLALGFVSVSKLVAALREVLTTGEHPRISLPADVPPVPLQSAPPEGWRTHECTAGPWARFTVSYPRTWHAMSGQTDPVHIRPDPRSMLDVSVTVTSHPEPVYGPQGLLTQIEALAEARGVTCDPSRVQLDRWGDDGWAGSWAWDEPRDGGTRHWRILALGHDQGTVFGMAEGDEDDLIECGTFIETILASITLPPADLLAPEFFPKALCELLNDRLGPGDPVWRFTPEGHLRCGDLVVRLPHLYRAYLEQGDLDDVASAVDRHVVSGDEFEGARWDDIAGRLRVVLRRADAMAGLPIVKIPLDGGIVACPVLDTDDRMVFIPEEEAERWGRDPRVLLTHAVAALSAAPVHLVEVRGDEDDELLGFQIADGDGYDSGRLLCPGVRASIEAQLGGPLIVMMPSAALVIVARDNDAMRIDLAEAATTGYARRPRPLSADLWSWTEAGLEPL